jgi:integrase
MVEFTLQTGLRRANVTHLEWSQVDLERKTAWVLGEQTKNGKALAVPLSDKAMSILESQVGKDPRWVFARRRAPVHQTSTRVWREAVERCGLRTFAGMTFATPGPVGTSRVERLCAYFKNWAVGRRTGWCSGMPI